MSKIEKFVSFFDSPGEKNRKYFLSVKNDLIDCLIELSDQADIGYRLSDNLVLLKISFNYKYDNDLFNGCDLEVQNAYDQIVAKGLPIYEFTKNSIKSGGVAEWYISIGNYKNYGSTRGRKGGGSIYNKFDMKYV